MKSRSWLAGAVLALAAAPALADLEAKATLGYEGRWVLDAATPVKLELTNTGTEPLVVEVRISQGRKIGGDLVQRRIVRLPASAGRDEFFLVPGPKGWSGPLEVELNVDPTVVIHSPTNSGDRGTLTFEVAGGPGYSGEQIPFASLVIGVVGDTRATVAARLRAAGVTGQDVRVGRGRVNVEVLGVPADLLRLAPLGLNGIDALLVCDPDAQFGADPATLEGLLDWVALGGSLVVSLGDHAGEFAASPLVQELPATWTGTTRTSYGDLLTDLGVSTEHASADGVWVSLRPGPLARPPAARQHDGDPIVAERPVGMGRIVVLPYDLRTLIAASAVEEETARRLLAPIATLKKSPEKDDRNSRSSTDFSSAIGRTLQAGAFEPPPLPLVVLGILLYVVVVGPLDWFVLKRLKKERLTTLTFLGAVLGFTLLAYGASLFLFSSGARVNRIVFADLADAGRDGRQVLRFTDLAGYYSPTGSDQAVAYDTPAAVLPAGLPGYGQSGDVGSPMPVQVTSTDALHPRAVVQLAFRSQRVIRVEAVGTLGSSLDVEWKDGGVRLVNGLAIDLEDVVVYRTDTDAYALGPVKSGETSGGGTFTKERSRRTRDFVTQDDDYGVARWGPAHGRSTAVSHEEVERMLEAITVGSWMEGDALRTSSNEQAAALRKAGLDRSGAFHERGHALVVAFARSFPVALPGAETEGETYVVLRKEVEIR